MGRQDQIKGDVRLRYEDVNVDNPISRSGNQDRERVRARVGFYSEINPQVDAGVRVATGSSADARSTNQSLDNYFEKKSLWVDLAYLDWHPTAVPNLHLIGGKMNQPWSAWATSSGTATSTRKVWQLPTR